LQLLEFGFGNLPLFDLRAQLSVNLFPFVRASFNAAFERFFGKLSIGNVKSDTVKRNRHVVLEMGPPTCRDPAFHPVRFSNDPILDIVDPVAPWIGASLDGGLDARKIIRMHARPPQTIVDWRARKQAPHCPQRVVLLQLVGLWIHA
jgi:hypothetical protein